MTLRFYIRDLKIGVFWHFRLTANVKKSRDQCPAVRIWGLRFTFVQHEHALGLSDLLQGFLHPKTFQSRV